MIRLLLHKKSNYRLRYIICISSYWVWLRQRITPEAKRAKDDKRLLFNSRSIEFQTTILACGYFGNIKIKINKKGRKGNCKLLSIAVNISVLLALDLDFLRPPKMKVRKKNKVSWSLSWLRPASHQRDLRKWDYITGQLQRKWLNYYCSLTKLSCYFLKWYVIVK